MNNEIKKENKGPLVVIFGRTNVGKSTLFNCLTEKKSALIADIEGTTRDSNIGKVSWNRMDFSLIDTGGIMNLKYLERSKKKKIETENKIEEIDIKVQNQARDYLTRADLILFLVDSKTGLLPQDKQMALSIKKILPNTENVILVPNKTDSPRQRKEIAEFNKLSLGELFPVSAATGSGTGDLLDLIVKKLKQKGYKASQKNSRTNREDEPINVIILGKPNVGKSSIINSILGEERIIVSPLPHTTREPQDTKIIYDGHTINLIDTAGISKKGQKGTKKTRANKPLENYSIIKSLKTLRRADIAILMIDIKEGVTKQEAKIVEEITGRDVSLIIVANKWDQIENRDTKEYTHNIYRHLPFIQWVPIQFVSALTGEKVNKVLDKIIEITEKRKIEISDSYLDKFLKKIVKIHRPTKGRGVKYPYIYEMKQTSSNPPKFFIRVGPHDSLDDTYIRFIENRLREKFDLTGTPIYIKVEKTRRVHGQHAEIKKLKPPKRVH